ncbi:MAG: LysM peptidoglycan-binding domain-containing protein [Aggregatilineales bacterium]
MRYRLIVVIAALCLLHGLAAFAQGDSEGGKLTVHVVQRGETLYRIAQRYNLSVDELVLANGITNPSSIQVGQRLLIPIRGAIAEAAPLVHVVRPGETLRSIGQLYRVSVEDLIARNQLLNPNVIYVGQRLVIGPGEIVDAAANAPRPPYIELPTETAGESEAVSAQVESTASDAGAPHPLIHVVQRGETLFRIAQSYGLTVNDLVQANSIADPTLIYVGQQLVIPGLQPPRLALDLPETIQSVEIAPQTLQQGKTMRLRITTMMPSTAAATFLGRDLSAIEEQDGTRLTFLQGIPLLTEPGIYPFGLIVRDRQSGRETRLTINLQIVGGGYGRENIRLLADRGGLLDPAVENAEQALIENIMSVFNSERYFEEPMGLPAAATVISPFGTLRSYNGGPFDRFHTGTDFAGAPGTPVLAAAPGRVVLADMLNVRGGATVIDHGWGVFTGYWHQAELYVKPGDFVTTGQVIGTIGATGRVTGAHLHWELWVGGVAVDPMQWVRQSFR